jgi:hypothetical protein
VGNSTYTAELLGLLIGTMVVVTGARRGARGMAYRFDRQRRRKHHPIRQRLR